MPVGDSITEGDNGDATYRYFLWHDLLDGGYSADFVGSFTGVKSGTPKYPDFDQDHSARSGWRAQRVLNQIKSWTSAQRPDVILLHIGSNDLRAGETDESTESEIRSIIGRARQAQPAVTFLLAELIPSQGLRVGDRSPQRADRHDRRVDDDDDLADRACRPIHRHRYNRRSRGRAAPERARRREDGHALVRSIAASAAERGHVADHHAAAEGCDGHGRDTRVVLGRRDGYSAADVRLVSQRSRNPRRARDDVYDTTARADGFRFDVQRRRVELLRDRDIPHSRRHGQYANAADSLACRPERGRLHIRRRRILRFDTWYHADRTARRDSAHAYRQRLLVGRTRRRDLRLR